jgi:gamma-glutamylcyclotransferase (GGCT)/AIG2-like uncharacterized protein YtfP
VREIIILPSSNLQIAVLTEEVESMAQNAMEAPRQGTPDDSTIQRWQHLFEFTAEEAARRIADYRTNISRPRISDAHWETVRLAKEAEGHDRESYGFSLIWARPASTEVHVGGRKRRGVYLLKLDPPYFTIEAVQQLLHTATRGYDSGDGKKVTFVPMDETGMQTILANLWRFGALPTFGYISMAEKDLCPVSRCPTLGIADTTPPQFRCDSDEGLTPHQDQYPVWYFFYGTLAEPDRLKNLLGLPFTPTLKEGTVSGGAIRTWAGKYKALVDGPEVVRGRVFEVLSREQEDSLRAYETEKYEVVRCAITLHDGSKLNGLTFRFVDASELD